MGSDNPPPPAGRLKARNKAQLIRALVVTLAVALLIYLTSDVADLNDGVPSATGPEPGPEYPPPARANSAKGAALEHAGDKFPTRSYARQDAMRRREDREVTGGSVSVKRSSGGEEAGAKAAVHEPLPVPPPKPVYHGLYDLSALDIKGVPQLLQQFGGEVVLVVNVASACGYTETNYDGLRELYNKYHKRGFTVLAFPCNQFGQQEPGTNEEVEIFARTKGAQFPLFSKIEVNGENTHEVFRYLKKHLPGEICTNLKVLTLRCPDFPPCLPCSARPSFYQSWNFNKFLVDRAGTPVKRYGPQFDRDEIERDILRYIDQ